MKAKDKQACGTHYKDMGVQPWDVVDTWSYEQQVGFYRASALKYLMRMGSKGSAIDDGLKAVHYVEKLNEVLVEARDANQKTS